jgi:thymidine phosphorylase
MSNHQPHDRAINVLQVRRLGIDTYFEPVVFMRSDCAICRSEGFESHSRILVSLRGHHVLATLNIVTSNLLGTHEIGLSEIAWKLLAAEADDVVTLSHPEPLESMRHVRAKVYGQRLDDAAMHAIIKDIAARKYTDIDLSAFITACAGDRLNIAETGALTRAMIAVGERLSWDRPLIVDKHSVGGLPGNRTTPIVVAIVAAAGLTMPKTSSRAITSPAGTADAMETLAPVALDVKAMRRVVEQVGGCIVWGGAVQLSPADDILIRVERPLDLDSEGQMIASILSKKAAAGATHVVIDMPVGPTAKIRKLETATSLETAMVKIGQTVGLNISVLVADGSQPVGRGIGPALEARDVLAVLRNDADAPQDLRNRAVALAGRIFEMAGSITPEAAIAKAQVLIDDGQAWRKFQAICEAQGGMRVPPQAAHTHVVAAPAAGPVISIDNRRLARVAKLAGAPQSPAAGLYLHSPVGTRVERGQPLFTLHAETPGELAYALAYLYGQPPVVAIANGQ